MIAMILRPEVDQRESVKREQLDKKDKDDLELNNTFDFIDSYGVKKSVNVNTESLVSYSSSYSSVTNYYLLAHIC